MRIAEEVEADGKLMTFRIDRRKIGALSESN